MTPDELREALRTELWARLEDCTTQEIEDAADIALRVVREALREPGDEMAEAARSRTTDEDNIYFDIWRAMLAASPLGGGDE